MKLHSGFIHALVLCAAGISAMLSSQKAFADDVDVLVRDAAYNEVKEHTHLAGWMYRLIKREGPHVLTEEQVDTESGPVYRILAIDDKPLDSEESQREDRRLQNFLSHPELQQKAMKQYLADEKRLVELMALLPTAFVYQKVKSEGDRETLEFRPNPEYRSDTYESRVLHALAGELVIDTREKRIAHLTGKLIEQVDFGYGVIGKVTKGGTFMIDRQRLSSDVWKTTLIDVNLNGRFGLFATLNKQEHDERSQFKKVPENFTVREAYQLVSAPPL